MKSNTDEEVSENKQRETRTNTTRDRARVRTTLGRTDNMTQSSGDNKRQEKGK